MRLALLGPAEGQTEALETAARFVLEHQAVDRAIYLGVDGALDGVVRKWAAALVGDNPVESGVWARAVRACLRADPAAIDRYIAAERERASLRIFESLADEGTRSVEMLSGALAVMIYDKAHLTEEDMLPARLLLFGKSRSPVVRQVGQRWFVSPGAFEEGGLMTMEDTDDGILLAVFDRNCQELRTERLSTAKATKLKVGAGG
jgi:hypothetical protein